MSTETDLDMLQPAASDGAHVTADVEAFIVETLTSLVGDPKSRLQRTYTGDTHDALVFLIENIAAELAVSFEQVERDRAESVRLAAELEASQRFAAIGQVVAGVAHELNGPLAHHVLTLRHLRTLIDPDSTQAHGLIDELLAGTRRMTTIVSDLAHPVLRQTERPRRTSVADVVRTAIKLAEHQVGRRVSVRARSAADLPDVHVIPARLVQVVLNLLLNAAAAYPTADPTAHVVHVDSGCVDSEVLIAVSDRGCGMDVDEQARVFEPFYTTRQDAGGRGIGLSVSARMVRDMNGELDVTSVVGEGSTFTIKLPATAPIVARQSDPPVVRPQRLASGTRVLFIDDAAALARALARLLRPADVTCATSVASGLEALADPRPYDVIICDMTMPDGDGVELFHKAVADDPTVAQRWLFLTGGALQEDGVARLARTGRPVLAKPVQPEQLLATIADVLG